MAGPKKNLSRPIETLGVAKALDGVRERVVDAMKLQYARFLEEERTAGLLSEVSEDLLNKLAAKASVLAGAISRESAGTGVAEAFQIGINRSAIESDHDEVTLRTENICTHCGRPYASPLGK